MANLTYEAFLDEVTTLITELYDLDDAVAIKLVVDAQDNGFFSLHDDREQMRTLEQARKDATTLFETGRNRQQTQERQQRSRAKKKSSDGTKT
jgi:hypothetical protein